ncbi:MAG TPA: GAF domain-containing protein, partial [Roseiflexaceae bacterium]
MTDDIGAGPEPAGEIAALRQRVAWLEQSLARCGADLTQRAAELAHVNEIGQALAAQLDFQAFVDLVGAKIGAIFDAEVVYIALYARETGLIHFPYYLEDGERQLPESAALGQGLTSIVIQSRQPLLLGTFQQQLDLGVLTDGRPSESWLGVPIVVGERVTGAISVQSFLPDHFTDADVRLLSTLTANIGVALENARLFQAERDQVQRQAAIFRLSAESAAAADEGAICERLARGLLDQALGYAYVGVFLLDEASGERMLRASAGLPTNIAGLRLASGQGLSGRALLDGQLHYTPDVTVDAQYVPALNSGSEVDVPIKIGAAIAGVLVVESHHPNAFGQADFDVLTAVANQAGVALGRARSLAETRRRVTELVTINSISQALAAQLELGALIELVGENMRRIFDAQIVYVALLDRASGRVTFPYYIEDDQLQSYTSIEFGEGLTSRIIETRQPLLLNQAEHAEEIRTKGVGTPARSYLGVPIMVGDEAIGVISVQSTRREGMFGEAELRLLATIAANVGVAIQNARLYEETRRRANEMAALAEIGHDITTTTNLDPVLER